MPKLRRAVYLVARRAATITGTATTMPALAPFPLVRIASVSGSFIDSQVGAFCVVGKKPPLPAAPRVDVVARCSSAADSAASPSRDTYAEKALGPRLTSKFFKDSDSSPAAYGRPFAAVLPGICTGWFSGHAKVCSGRDSRNYTAVGDALEATQTSGEAASAEGELLAAISSTGEDVFRAGEAFSGEVENEAEEELSGEKARGERRRRGVVSPSRPSPTEWRDLLTVPGIGRRNMEKLVAKGIARLDELKQLYRDKVFVHRRSRQF